MLAMDGIVVQILWFNLGNLRRIDKEWQAKTLKHPLPNLPAGFQD